MKGAADQNRVEIVAEDVASWCNFTDAEATEGEPGWLERTRVELGQRMIGRQEFASLFSRRLFIDYCIAVNDAFVEASMPPEVAQESFVDPLLARGHLARVESEARQLIETLKMLDKGSLALLACNYSVGPPRERRWRWEMLELQELLAALASDAADGARLSGEFVRSGANMANLSRLIIAVAGSLRGNGHSVEAKASGPLHSLCRLALEVPEFKEVFGDPADLRGSIRSILKRPGETLNPFLAAMFRA